MLDRVVAKDYRLKAKIGSGGFGEIYIAEHIRTHNAVAIKLEPTSRFAPQLASEAHLYKLLSGGPGIPHLRWFGSDGSYNVLVIDLLGESLESLSASPLSLKTTLMLADQMLSCIQFLHAKGYVHRDIKPANFVIGRSELANQLFMIDYGLVAPFRDPETGAHVAPADCGPVVGTTRYASIGALRGCTQSRRDDLEAAAYALVWLMRRALPWASAQSIERTCEAKLRATVQDVCAGLPREFADFLTRVRALEFDEEPDYAGYRQMFRDLFVRRGFVFDYRYDWLRGSPAPPARRSIGSAGPDIAPFPARIPLTKNWTQERIVERRRGSATFRSAHHGPEQRPPASPRRLPPIVPPRL